MSSVRYATKEDIERLERKIDLILERLEEDTINTEELSNGLKEIEEGKVISLDEYIKKRGINV